MGQLEYSAMESESSPESSDATANPVVAAGRKLKSSLRSQEPSVRIVRRGKPQASQTTPNTQGGTPVSTEAAASSGFFSSLGSYFTRKSPPDQSYAPRRDEYDDDTVDILDVVGRFSAYSRHVLHHADETQTRKSRPFPL